MKCVIFGGAGFIGSHITDALVAKGHDVRVFDHPNISTRNLSGVLSKIEVVGGDFFNEKDLAPALSGAEVAVHLVSSTIPSSSNENPTYDVQTNLIGSLRLMKLAREAGIKKIIYASSGGTVYGRPTVSPIPETHPTEPLCSYGITKLTIEKYLQLYQYLYGLDYVVLRISNPFGERQNPLGGLGAVATFLSRVAEGKPVTIWGDGTVRRDYLYIGDLANAFVKAIEQSPSSKIFNIGSGASLSLNELLEAIESVTGKSPEVEYTPARKLDVPISCLDIQRAKEELAWSPQISLREGLAKTWGWINANNK